MAYGSKEIMVYDGDAEIADSQWPEKKLRVPQTRSREHAPHAPHRERCLKPQRPAPSISSRKPSLRNFPK